MKLHLKKCRICRAVTTNYDDYCPKAKAYMEQDCCEYQREFPIDKTHIENWSFSKWEDDQVERKKIDLSALPSGQQKIIQFLLEGYTQREIAKLLGYSSQGGVWNSLQQAIKTLKFTNLSKNESLINDSNQLEKKVVTNTLVRGEKENKN